MKIICIVESLYSLLIFLLIKDPDINLKDTFLITSGKEYKFLKNKFNQTIFLKKYQNRYLKIFNKIKYFIYFFILEIIYNLKNKLVYGNDHTTGAFYFLRKYTFIVIEDGLINYNKDIYIKNYCKYRKYILSFPMFGQYKTVKKIYLTGLAPIPEKIKSKVEIINLKELWNKKKINEQKEILNLFGFNPIIIKNIKNRKLILFTQPLSEDNLITEEEKIKLYSKIIANYNKEKLIIKKHPREKTDYKKIFKEIVVLEENFPAEIFFLLNIKFKKAITIFSTAVLNLEKNIEIDFYGTEIHPILYKRFGSQNQILKRNKIL